jgi:hypothetical protein
MSYPGRCPGLIFNALSGTTDNSLGFQPQAVVLEPKFFNTKRSNIARKVTFIYPKTYDRLLILLGIMAGKRPETKSDKFSDVCG